MIKIDMEMPLVCGGCPCRDGRRFCNVKNRELAYDNMYSFKPEWCPLHEDEKSCVYCIHWKEKSDFCIEYCNNGLVAYELKK